MNELIITNELPEDINEVQANEWGCFFKNHFLKLLPKKEIDKLSINKNGIGSNVNSKLTYISEKRNERKSDAKSSELLGRIINAEKKDIIIAKDSSVLENKLFSGRPEFFNLNDALAATTVNKYPSGLRCVDEEIYKLLNNEERLCSKVQKITFMPCIMTFPTKYPNELKILDEARINNPLMITGDYFQELDKTPLKHIEAMLSSMQASIKAYVKKAKSSGINEIIIRPFINQGMQAGASLRRLHSQTYIDFTSGHTSNDESILKAFSDNTDCLLCKDEHAGRELYANESFNLWVTNAPIHNYHLRLAPNPNEHVERFTDLNKKQIHGLADALKTGNSILSAAKITNNRNTLFRTLFEGYNQKFHFYVELIPNYPEGAVEKFGGISVVWLNPANASEQLKEAMKDLEVKDYTY